jgi:phage-related minor tail protein
VGSKQIYATHSLEQANEQYVFQTELIGANARAQEIANVKRKNFLAVEQQIWEAEQSGTQLSIATEQRLRDEAVKSTVTIIKAIDARWEAERAWETGVTKALNSYIESVTNAAAQAERLFTNAFKGMEDALVRFVQTGKLDFKSLANSIIADLIRIQIQNSIMKPLAQATSGMSLSGMFSSAGNFISGLFKAGGGPVAANQPYIVGEEGRKAAGIVRRIVDHRRAERFGQPAGIGEEAFGLARHVVLLQMLDQARRLRTLGLGDRFENARLGDPAEIILDSWCPARRDHVESHRAGEDMGMVDPACDRVR